MSPRLARVVLGVFLCAAAAGCKQVRAMRGGGGAAFGSGKPPLEAWKPGEWKSAKGQVFTPPESAKRPWRVLMLQEQPRPKKNPRWKPVRVEESGELEMPSGSRFRCIYGPVDYRAYGDEEMEKVVKWEAVRTVRCSNDGWLTYSQAANSLTTSGDGGEVVKAADQAELYLHDRISGKPVDITIILRPD